MDTYSYLRKKIDSIIPRLGKRKLAIYPCGKIGKYVKGYIEDRWHLPIGLLIDNYKAQEDNSYIATKDLIHMNCEEFIFLIASNSAQYYTEIRREIRRYAGGGRNIVDLFPEKQIKREKKKAVCKAACMRRLLYPHGKDLFLRSLRNVPETRILDVGCGNRSPQVVKSILDKVYYVGIDVGDYNQTNASKKYADEYHIVSGEEFAAEIEKHKDAFDAVISSHNIEHCKEPERVLRAMIASLSEGGRIYMAFPSEESQYFPGDRNGCLNFYDDSSHNKVPNWAKINSILEEQNIQILFRIKNNRPYLLRKIGELNETKSAEMKTVLAGTWEYYGFESIIWGKKRRNKRHGYKKEGK